MTKRKTLCLTLIASVAPALTGCMPTMTIEQMKEMMPKRPAELDKLTMFAGEWESTGEAEFAGLDRILKSTGNITTAWENDKWCLVEHSEFEIEELGSMKGIGIWTYDSKSRKYRSWWFDSMGTSGRMTCTYDESARIWTMKGKSRSDWGTTTGRGTVKFIDDDTMEWSFTERAFLGLFKVGEYKGTNRRK